MFVLFYTPWCGYCKAIKPAWSKLQKRFPGKLVKVNGDDNKSLTKLFGVDGYPTIYFCPNGQNNPLDAVMFEGERSEEGLLKFIREHGE